MNDPIQRAVSQSLSDADIAAAMAKTCVALKLPPEDKSVLGRIRSAWWEVGYWWTNNVFYRFPKPVRMAWYSFSWWWYEQVSSRIWPRQAWLIKAIPRTHVDKVSLLPTVIFAIITRFVDKDGEDCFGTTDWEASGKAAEAERLKVVYEWAKTGRAAFQQRIQDAHPKDVAPLRFVPCADNPEYSELVQDDPRSYEELYGEVNRLEAEFERLDLEHMITVVTLTPYLWT